MISANLALVSSTEDVDDAGRTDLDRTQHAKHHRSNEHRIDGDQHRGDEPQRESGAAYPGRTAFSNEVADLRQIGVTRDERSGETYQVRAIHTRTLAAISLRAERPPASRHLSEGR